MKNRNIVHAREEVKIYGDYYKPSLNVLRFAKSIFSVLLYGSSMTQRSMYERKRFSK
jgi:hypothetical protein